MAFGFVYKVLRRIRVSLFHVAAQNLLLILVFHAGLASFVVADKAESVSLLEAPVLTHHMTHVLIRVPIVCTHPTERPQARR
ncbi:hypothetical protein B0J15DRAFT_500907 [Fusarium solani]|uniref:Uncharacterized protein n=1 Tax=Fusarium solani TaxID=169388 RepID=A0A9P9GTK4_FUSSL|nr:uncharacterized protein B0J15DRAFT_500907 [Fusarium solani]KAH7244896.1 hypothetical protein B0J15DRAFT_500907 [Fusarium solani]